MAKVPYLTPAPGAYNISGSCDVQVSSVNPSAPKFSFAASTTERKLNPKLFLNHGLNQLPGAMDGGSIESPGPGKYHQPQSSPIVAQKGPSFTLGTRRKRVVGEPLPATDSVCAPGSYSLNRSILTAQSHRTVGDSSRDHTMGTSTRNIFGAQESLGRSLPGPGAYAAGAAAQQLRWRRPRTEGAAAGTRVGPPTVRAHQFGMRREVVVGETKPTQSSAGVGSYNLRGGMTDQVSHRSNAASANHMMGTARRDIFGKQKSTSSAVPGPGAYGTAPQDPAVGRQRSSRFATAPAAGWGRSRAGRPPVNFGRVG